MDDPEGGDDRLWRRAGVQVWLVGLSLCEPWGSVMGSWVEEKPTMELRWVVKTSPPDDAYGLEMGMTLQQLWKIAKGGLGRVYYIEEWRDVPIMHEKDEPHG